MKSEVVVIGAGPAGSSCAYWLASAGHEVTVIEKKVFPRDKTCGDGLTPRAVAQLADMGLAGDIETRHLYTGLRAWGFGRVLELEWPEHPRYPSVGYTVTRHDLDALVANHAVKAGATLLQGNEVTGLIREDGRVAGVLATSKNTGTTEEVFARYLVVTDGANSRIGRELGARRVKEWPQGMAIRGYWESPRHDEPWIESHLDIAGDGGELLPGYGWIFPLGDGRINLGVGLLDTNRHAINGKAVNTTKLLDAFLRKVGARWQIDVDAPCTPPTGGRLPMGLAVGPRSGPNYLLAGDATGSINPFNGEGISYAYETGRMAAGCIASALEGGGSAALSRYDQMVENEFGSYYRLGRAFVRAIGHPAVLRACVGGGMRSKAIMGVVMRVMANLLRPESHGVAESAVATLEALTRMKDRITG